MQRTIVVGKHSGAHSIKQKLSTSTASILSDEQILEVVEKVKKLAESGKDVDDAELVALASHVMGQNGEGISTR